MFGISVKLRLPRLTGCHILFEVRAEVKETLSIRLFCEVRTEADERVVYFLLCEVRADTEKTVEHLAYNTTHHNQTKPLRWMELTLGLF
jgi:hypothetical protein